MPTFQKCPFEVNELANLILKKYEENESLVTAGVTIDFVFAYSDKDENTGEPLNNALNCHGCKALGITRKIPLKDRAQGRSDAEIALDGDWWNEASIEEKESLLDHEIHHLQVRIDKRGLVRDDLDRPVITLRKHDYEFGWFKSVAARHGLHSMERLQASQIMCDAQQYFWPGLRPQTSVVDVQTETPELSRVSRLEMRANE